MSTMNARTFFSFHTSLGVSDYSLLSSVEMCVFKTRERCLKVALNEYIKQFT